MARRPWACQRVDVRAADPPEGAARERNGHQVDTELAELLVELEA